MSTIEHNTTADTAPGAQTDDDGNEWLPGTRRTSSSPSLAKLPRFAHRNGLINRKYGRLALRWARRRFLTRAGWRWRTDGLVFLGPGLAIEIGPNAQIDFGRFVWIGDGTKLRCHEGLIEIGAKTVMGQECTISAYDGVRIGEQCVIADRAMFIDFDHNVADVEAPIRQQGIYKRPVEIGNNCWIGYGACVLRGVRIGDNSIVGANSIVTRDIPPNSVVAGAPARIIRTREAPKHLSWARPVEPPAYGPPGPR